MIGATELANRAGITYRQLDHWTRRGYLHATDDPMGAGYPRQYDDEQALLAMHMARLVKAGLSPELARDLAISIRSDGYAKVGGFLLVPVA